MTIQNRRIFASILFVLISFVCVGQVDLPPPSPPSPPPGFPIDGGVIFGVLIAIFYGVRKILFSSGNSNK
ncbi:PID-CTERM protein-sorting domain-containing protein [Seonamhaeicola sp.]|uniref:PID-CTERM protein-sorting domain-containing protein n=1 Tax=Seonamhaeicola sp. TaxID=1912245 RepID=UPI003566CA4D